MSTLPADAQIDGTSTIGTTTTSPDEMMGTYNFPIEKLGVLKNPSKTPLVLVSCGSFSPVTVLHLRMQEMARDWARSNTGFEVVGRYMSPVGDAYGKAGLASAKHRVEMCRLAVADSEIEIDSWEALQKEYQPTARVLDHFEEEINDVYGGVKTSTGEKRKAKIALLAGADLIQTMSTPGVWSEKDLDHILGHYGAFIIERTGTDSDAALEGLQQWKDNIYFIHQLVSISPTLFIRFADFNPDQKRHIID